MKKIGFLLASMLVVLAVLPTGKCEASESFSKPQVSLTSYSLNDEKVVLGKDNSIHLEFTNLSNDLPVTDVLVSFTSLNNTVRPVYGKSNQLYFSEIEANGTVETDLPINIVYQENGYSSMSFLIEYCVGEEVLCNEMSYIVIPADVAEKLVVENISVSSSAQVNSKVSLLVNYQNAGETTLQDVYLTVNCVEFEKPLKLLVKEGLAAGEKGYFEYYLAFDSVGNKKLSLTLSGADEAGDEYVINGGEYSVQVLEEETTGNNTSNVDETDKHVGHTEPVGTEQEALNVYVVIGIIAVIVIVCLLIGAFSTKKRAK